MESEAALAACYSAQPPPSAKHEILKIHVKKHEIEHNKEIFIQSTKLALNFE